MLISPYLTRSMNGYLTKPRVRVSLEIARLMAGGSRVKLWPPSLMGKKHGFNSPKSQRAEFRDYAKKNLVLVEVDFPRTKQQTEKLKKDNQALQEKYKIEGYPTIIVLDGEGKKVGELGYQPGGPKSFIAELDKLKRKT